MRLVILTAIFFVAGIGVNLLAIQSVEPRFFFCCLPLGFFGVVAADKGLHLLGR